MIWEKRKEKRPYADKQTLVQTPPLLSRTQLPLLSPMSPTRAVHVLTDRFIANASPFIYFPPLSQLTEKYGDIFSVQLGSTSFVFINGLRMVKEVLVNQGENFIGRPEIPIDSEVFSSIGELSLRGNISAVGSKH